MSKRISAFILSFVLCLFSFSFAISALEDIQNFTIENGTASWDVFPGAYEYEVIIGAGGGYFAEPEANLYEMCRSYNFESGTYNFCITAVNEQYDYISEELSGTYDYVSTAERLASPTGLAWDGIKCVWNKVENASSYYVELTDSSGMITETQIVYGGECSYRFSVEKYEAGESYSFSVQAAGDGYLSSETAESDLKTMTAEDLVLLPAPDVKIDENGYAVWDAVPGVYGYNISYNDNMSGGNTTDTFTDFRYFISLSGSESGLNHIAIFAIDENAQRLSEIWEYDYNYVKCVYYNVYFDLNGMNAEFESISPYVLEGTAAERPADPFTESFEFCGWYTDVECTAGYDFSSPVNADITLYAKWKEKVKIDEDASDEESDETSEDNSEETSYDVSEAKPGETSEENPLPKDDKSGSMWLWIIVDVIAAAVLSSLVTYLIMKKRK